MKTLLPCPCCGGKAFITLTKEQFDNLVAKNGCACLPIECENSHTCGLMMFCHHDSTDYDEMVSVATDCWNRRIDDVQEHLAN